MNDTEVIAMLSDQLNKLRAENQRLVDMISEFRLFAHRVMATPNHLPPPCLMEESYRVVIGEGQTT